jgi:hypothetical protein
METPKNCLAAKTKEYYIVIARNPVCPHKKISKKAQG